ncbi:hypothetical protein SmJEL517_g02701 [Synchytrium microbalum]|uniref:Uncharacterized protein n=1 Tax=Synchytrium microbalum TaxID=1806994 RepID=A0A507C5A9_9FUNG|nr:uncharacterized protein SmJEL517_g02701 [Synchytrium microbalum]TPX34671.1 hypothetical protein SmJEL517_g02701 [Synchytrium microbalum]
MASYLKSILRVPVRRFASTDNATTSNVSRNLLQRSPSAISKRIVATQFLLSRWGIESVHRVNADPRVVESHNIVKASIEVSGISSYFTDAEKPFIDAKLGAWNDDDIHQVGKRWESLGMLLWTSLIIPELPTPYTQFTHESLFKASSLIPALPSTVTDFVEYFTNGAGAGSDHFRADQDLKEAIDVAEAWYWRSQMEQISDLKRAIEADETNQMQITIPAALRKLVADSDVAIRQASISAYNKLLIKDLIDHDFGVDGQPYASLEPDRKHQLADIAEARLTTLTWLADNTREWDYKEVKYFNPLNSIFNV